MSVNFTLPKDYAAVAVVGMSTFLLHLYHGNLTIRYRIAAKIPHPQCYAEVKQMEENPMAKKFTCASRAHANMIDQFPLFLMALGWTGLRYPLISAGLGVGWILTRVIYTKAYCSDNPNKRVPWFVASNSVLLAIIGFGTYSSWELYNGWW